MKFINIFTKKHTKITNKKSMGNKGYNLSKINKMGISTPPGFTITTEVSNFYLEHKKFPQNFMEELDFAINAIEEDSGKKLRGEGLPLLLSVRSGAPVSMPGMMDTILNLGININITERMCKIYNTKFAYDSYRRFIELYSKIVLGLDTFIFNSIIAKYKQKNKAINTKDLSTDSIIEITDKFQQILRDKNKKIPTDYKTQLTDSIIAIINSWNNPRAKQYRKIYKIPANIGTAVTVQAMVFGNLNNQSATGVVFSRNPTNGQKELYGDYLIKAQGEDVVSGSSQTLPVIGKENDQSLENKMPQIFNELQSITNKLEIYYQQMQDIEFTIENNKLFILQSRTGKRSPGADIKIALDMFKEKIIDKQTAINNISPSSLLNILHSSIDENYKKTIISRGLPASPGAVTGIAAFSVEDVENLSKTESKIIMIRQETSTEDIQGLNLCSGILTTTGGITSHASVVARGMGKPCICGASSLFINQEEKILHNNKNKIKTGDWLTIDGSTGDIILGKAKIKQNKTMQNFDTFVKWLGEGTFTKIFSNADTAEDIKNAIAMGCHGIGLCRTEHMFFEKEKIMSIRSLLITPKAHQEKILTTIEKIQREDFIKIFTETAMLPITIRLLDPPLHEFLPRTAKDITALAEYCQITEKEILKTTEKLTEHNPMLGQRGCRLGILFPEIYKMQITAITNAVMHMSKKRILIKPSIMVPFIMNEQEIIYIKKLIQTTISKIDKNIEYEIGTMIELPSAALNADKIAKHIDFISFGTNDLTQATLGLSRDDCGSLISQYIHKKILPADPFVQLELNSVGELIKIAIKRARESNPKITIGLCGEQGANEETIKFLIQSKINYISCSPYRMPLTQLYIAQNQLEKKENAEAEEAEEAEIV